MMNEAACILAQLHHTTLALQGISVGQMHTVVFIAFVHELLL